jgi:hypothetical protein
MVRVGSAANLVPSNLTEASVILATNWRWLPLRLRAATIRTIDPGTAVANT